MGGAEICLAVYGPDIVIASAAKQSILALRSDGSLRRKNSSQ
jgi:hypothetical protein